MKYVYVITSSEEDIYLEQTFLSMYSLRIHEKDAHIVLLTDNLTNANLVGVRSRVNDIVNEKIVVEFDDSITNMRRSRHLKTSMRNLIDGDFLYIDGDTIINAPLHDIKNCSFLIGAVEDAHRPLVDHYGKEKLTRQAAQLGFDFSSEQYYFNGGVMFVKDCQQTREFFAKWHENWKQSSSKGLNLDMPALIKTNIEMGHIINRLPGEWNCQVMYGLNYYNDARIIHYFASRYTRDNGGYIYKLMNPEIFNKLKVDLKISPELHEMVTNPLKQFSNNLEMVGGTDVFILNTHVYKLVRMIYVKKPKVFAALQYALFRINNLKKKKSE